MLSDLCAKCGDGIQWIGYRALWMSETTLTDCEVCPKGGQHEPAYSVG